MAIARSDMEIRSPAVRRMSSSRCGGSGVICWARSSSSSVVSPMALTTTTTSLPARLASAIRLATRFTLRASPTDEPPYFCTTSAMRLPSVAGLRLSQRPAGWLGLRIDGTATGTPGTGAFTVRDGGLLPGEDVPGEPRDEGTDHDDEDDADEPGASCDGHAGPDVGPDQVRRPEAETERPDDVAARHEEDQRPEVGGEVHDLGDGRGGQEGVPEGADEADHEERPGARPEQAVV